MPRSAAKRQKRNRRSKSAKMAHCFKKPRTHTNKENKVAMPTQLVSYNDPILTYKIEVEEPMIQAGPMHFLEDVSMPIKIEKCESADEDISSGIRMEETLPFPGNNSTEGLNILIEWALNLQFDHSQSCAGRLYPYNDIFENLECKIVVLYCTVCKRRMLHTLKDWTE